MEESNCEVPIKCIGISVILLKKINAEYKVLLMKRASNLLHDMWCYIGGGIEKGEKAWEAALREVKEETGITNVKLYTSNKFEQFYNALNNYIYVAPIFVAYVDDFQEVQLNFEHKDFKWLSFKEAQEIVSLPGNDDVLEYIEKHFANRNPTKWLLIDY